MSAIDEVKSRIDIVDLVGAYVPLQRAGRNFRATCPFHTERTPSFYVSPERQTWHCFGACARGGSVIDWVMQAEHVSFRQAITLLQSRTMRVARRGVAAHGQRPTTHAPGDRSPLVATWDPDDQRLLRQVVAYYHATLKESPEALAYLQQRGLTHPDMLAHFQLGYANRTVPYRLPAHWTKEGTAIRERLMRLGILRATGHEHFAGCVVIPILDEHGAVVDLYGRRITDHRPAGTPAHLYRPGPHRGVWNVPAFAASKEIILCEALLDALTFWCAGYRHVTASCGVNGFTAEHLDALKHYGVARVLIAYDRDAAGDRAASTLAERLMAEGIGCARVEFPKGMDANEYALKVQPAAKALGLLLQHARWLGPGPQPPPTGEVIVVTSSPASAESPTSAPAPREAATAPPSPPEPAPPSFDTLRTPSLVEGQTAASERTTAPQLDEVVLQMGPRRYRIRGLAKNLGVDQLKINLLVSDGDRFHVDTLDLYTARQRTGFIKHAALELAVEEDTIKKELGQVLRLLEEHQEQHLRETLTPKPSAVTLTAEEREAALVLLEDPQLLDRILADFDRCGLVGEETNKLVGYLALVSRKLEEPLAILLQSSSAAGKSALMDALLAFVPEEERVQYSAMTGQALFYMGAKDLKHKVLAIVEDEGAARAAYALKLLQSEGVLTIASTGKDPQTGKLITHEYTVEGPVMPLLTSTALELDEELQNRCLVLTVNEDREQTRAIHRRQREAQTLEGLLAKRDRTAFLQVHKNAQRLLRPLWVVNPYARALTFPDTCPRLRRDHAKYLTLIKSAALLHQYQRPVKTQAHRGRVEEYIEVTLEDLTVANRLAHEVLGRSLDELAPQTRRLLLLMEQMVRDACERVGVSRADYRFTRKDVRRTTGWSHTQVRLHLQRLVELEYLLVHHGRNGQQFVYELLYDGQGQEGQPFVPGLLDVNALRRLDDTDLAGPQAHLAGAPGHLAGTLRAARGHPAPTLRAVQKPTDAASDAALTACTASAPENRTGGAACEGG